MCLLITEAYLHVKTILTLANITVYIISASIKFSSNIEDQKAFRETKKKHQGQNLSDMAKIVSRPVV